MIQSLSLSLLQIELKANSLRPFEKRERGKEGWKDDSGVKHRCCVFRGAQV